MKKDGPVTVSSHLQGDLRVCTRNRPRTTPSPAVLLAPPLPPEAGHPCTQVRSADYAAQDLRRGVLRPGVSGCSGFQSELGARPPRVSSEWGEGSRAGLRTFGYKPPITLALTFTNSVQSLSLDFVLIHKGHSLSNFATL